MDLVRLVRWRSSMFSSCSNSRFIIRSVVPILAIRRWLPSAKTSTDSHQPFAADEPWYFVVFHTAVAIVHPILHVVLEVDLPQGF